MKRKVSVHYNIKLTMLGLSFLFLIIIIKLVLVSTSEEVDGVNLRAFADNRNTEEKTLYASRGTIYDRNNNILAVDMNSYTVIAYLSSSRTTKEENPEHVVDKENTARMLAPILEREESTLLELLNRENLYQIELKRGITENKKNEILALDLPGIDFIGSTKRYYPYGNILSHVLGYVGIDNQGLSGIELNYDSYLTGASGAIKYFSDGKGNRLELTEVYEEPQNGINIDLTIDIDLQLAVENELDNVVSKYNPEQALILAMNPKTGEILAMASRPNFNPNSYQTSSVEVINRNLPIWMTYEPGSTFKIITLAASLEEQTINLFQDNYYDGGSITVEGARIKCWKAGGHGAETMLQVVENSCNPGFVVMGQKLGADRLLNYIHNFGFGKKTGIDLNGEANGILFSLDKMGPVELATTSFGQGISVTPIQQVRAVSAAVNGGILHTPYIVQKMTEPETNSVIKLNTADEGVRVISEETSKMVRYALESVVANGSGKNAYIENYRVGGKTGTAQKVNNGVYMVGNYIVSFMGFMPTDDPELVVYVAIDNPKGITQYGGVVSAPIAKNIFKAAIDLYDFPKTNEGMPREYTWLDTKYVLLPDVTGMNLEEAKKALKGFQVLTSGTGAQVTYQSPEGNYYVPEGSKVSLLLST